MFKFSFPAARGLGTKAIANGGAKLRKARADLEHFVIRYELSGDVYCDMHAAQQDEAARVRAFGFPCGAAVRRHLCAASAGRRRHRRDSRRITVFAPAGAYTDT